MNYAPCALWRTPPPDHLSRLDALLDAGLGRGALRVFCRADDIGLGGAAFQAMMSCFAERGIPLALAVVPAWLPLGRARLLRGIDPAEPLWALHQHGFAHRNAALLGKKAEFGPDLPRPEKARRLERGRTVLRHAFGGHLVPLFTPPWNRCDAETLDILAELEFSCVSRWQDALPPTKGTLRELPVNMDLHIRKEADPEAQFQGLLAELRAALSLGWLGLMLHHQRQTPHALAFLARLLDRLAATPETRFVNARTFAVQVPD